MASVVERQSEVARDRRQPISPELRSLLETVAAETGVGFEITSGGQRPRQKGEPKTIPGERTGSDRHDHGNAADLKAFVVEDGKKRYLDFTDPADNEKWSRVVQLAVAGGATGIGAGSDYMGNNTVHIGYGSELTWGAGGRSANAPKWLRDAYSLGTKTPPLNIVGPAPTPADMPNRIQTARLGADDAGIGTAFSQLERFGQPGANPLVMSDEMAYATGRNRDVPLPRARPAGPMADVPLPRPRVSPPTPPSPSLSSGIVDSVRSPQLMGGGVGIPNEQIPGSDATYSGANRMSTGGLGALLGRSVPPATPNPSTRSGTTITGRPDAPIGSMPARSAPDPAGHDQMLAARNPVPPPGVIKTANGIAGTVQLPRDVRPNVPQIAPPPAVPQDTSFTQSPYYTPSYSGGGMPSAPKTAPNPAYRAPAPAAPMPASQSPSLAVQRAAATPTNFITAGQYTYVKGPNGYERVNAPNPATQSAGLAASRNVLAPPRTSVRAGSSGSSGTRITNSSGTGAFGTSSSGRKFNSDTNRWEYA